MREIVLSMGEITGIRNTPRVEVEIMTSHDHEVWSYLLAEWKMGSVLETVCFRNKSVFG